MAKLPQPHPISSTWSVDLMSAAAMTASSLAIWAACTQTKQHTHVTASEANSADLSSKVVADQGGCCTLRVTNEAPLNNKPLVTYLQVSLLLLCVDAGAVGHGWVQEGHVHGVAGIIVLLNVLAGACSQDRHNTM